MVDRLRDPQLRGFARDLARLKRELRNVQLATQAAFTSVEDGAIDVYDEDGVLRERVGKQKDGSYGRLSLEGPVPPAPSEPDVVVIGNGVVAITWDGRCEEKWPFAEFEAVRVHLDDTEDFTPSRDNQVGAIFAHRGGTIVAVTESDDDNPVYVRLVAVSKAGHTSAASEAVLVDEEDEDGLADADDEVEWEANDGHTLTQADLDAGTVTFALSHDPEAESLTAFWGGLFQEPTEYTVDYDADTVTFPLAGFEQVGDRLAVHYAHIEEGAAGGFPAEILKLDPLFYYRFEEDADATTAYDQTGHNYVGGGLGAGLMPGAPGYLAEPGNLAATSIDGFRGVLPLLNGIDAISEVHQPLTVMVIVQLADPCANEWRGSIVSAYGSVAVNNVWELCTRSGSDAPSLTGQLMLRDFRASGGPSLHSGANLIDGQPHIVIASINTDTGDARINVDGTVATANFGTIATPAVGQKLIVGGNSGFNYLGGMDEFAFWHRVLTPAEEEAIVAAWNQYKGA